MFTVRASDKKTGQEIHSRFSATEVTPETRHTLSELYNYTCLACDKAFFHWRKETRRKGNQDLLPETFVRNRSSAHETGCRYDYERLTQENSGTVYIRDGRLHIRLNFPIGSAARDLSPPRADFNKAARGSASVIEKKPIGSMRLLVDFLEKNFSSLDDPALNDIDFDYQGKVFAWRDLFIPKERYKTLYNHSRQKDPDGSLVVVYPRAEIKRSNKGKPRFVCEMQYAEGNRNLRVKPILVCKDEEMADHIRLILLRRKTGWDKNPEEAKKDCLLVAARPFQPDYEPLLDKNIYLSVMENTQLARIDRTRYWDSAQMTFADKLEMH